MKIKKIEISAFRIYNNPEDATFDFTTNTGEPSDFISLYAPNGFGKTSFYDALEWSITGSVNRFFVRHTELDKLSKAQYSENESNIPLLRNSSLERDTYVNVYSDKGDEFKRNIPKGSKRPDLVLKDNPISHPFHKISLSQEWISAFLTESKGEERYKKFMDTPELKPIECYYSNLKHLLSVQDYKEDDINKEITHLRQRYTDISDKNLLDVINSRIAQINLLEKDNNIKFINIESTENEILQFRDLVSNKMLSLKRNIDLFLLRIDQLRIAKTGDNKSISLKAYFDKKNNLEKITKQLQNKKEILDSYNKYDKICNQLNSELTKFEEIIAKKKLLEEQNLRFSNYETIANQIQSFEEQDYIIKKSIAILNEEIDVLKKKEISLDLQLKSDIEQVENNSEMKNNLSSLKKEAQMVNSEIENIKKNISDAETQNILLEQNIQKKQIELDSYSVLLEKIRNGSYIIEDFLVYPEQHKVVKELFTQKNALNSTLLDLESVNKQIADQDEFHSSIKVFIEQGLDIINKDHISKCPLCEHQYDNFDTLARKITNNKFLDDTLQDLIKKKQNLNTTITSINKEIEVKINQLINYFTLKANCLSDENLKTITEYKSGKNHIDILKKKHEELKNKKIKNYNFLNGLSFEEFESGIDTLILNHTNSIKKITEELQAYKSDITKKDTDIRKLNEQIVYLNTRKNALLNEVEYQTTINIFIKYFPLQPKLKSTIEYAINELNNEIKKINNHISLLKKNLLSLSDILNEYRKESLIADIDVLNSQKTSIDNSLQSYIYFFKNHLDFNITDLDESQITKYIENNIIENKQNIDTINKLYEEYVLVDRNSEHISFYLQNEKVKKLLAIKENELKEIKEIVRPRIETERLKTKQYIEKRIRDFFYEELINKLYSKIDPHPDFKEVKFVPNLEGTNPRLDIFVKNRKSQELIPNLYFSTAQINILSLSIFLATALQSKEYDCILIDDPIQSMDSINVLSTIDLFRSIAVNSNKQLIVSTHDENFHKLLQKKIPSKLFKSKFLELAGLGKLKQVDS